MSALAASGYFLVSFAAMEAVAWLTHKYIMHGVLWHFHKDHHQKESDSFLEKNDLFFVFFAVPGMLLIYNGVTVGGAPPSLWMGLGITAYGLAYFLVHDVFIHRRITMHFSAVNTYFAAIRKAHKVHHKHLNKEDGECFGMLWAPVKYFREALKSKRQQ
ncbi:MAG: sterol desaturase family protein [Chitinophagales bacterium]